MDYYLHEAAFSQFILCNMLENQLRLMAPIKQAVKSILR